jgi:hypothetical protein
MADGRSWDDAGQVMMQRAALVGRIVHRVIMTIAVVSEMMMVGVVRSGHTGKIGCDISLDFADMLQVSRGQRGYADDLRKKKQAKKPLADMQSAKP